MSVGAMVRIPFQIAGVVAIASIIIVSEVGERLLSVGEHDSPLPGYPTSFK